jgi:RNA polymerase sigma factor (sigma-70 family)
LNYLKSRSVEALFKSYSRGMYNICLRMTGNKQDAEDVIQDAFLQAYINFGKLKSIDSFGAWIKKIVINQCIKFLRSRVLFIDIESAAMEYDDTPEEEIKDFSMDEINMEIQKLPDGCRIVFNLYLLENYTHKDIAEMLDISESTSKSQYQRARRLLQQQFKNKKVYG